MSNFKEQYEAGIAAIRRDKLGDCLFNRIERPVTSCRDQAPQFLVDVLMSGITLAFYNDSINDRFDRTKFELCFQLMETPAINPSDKLQAAWQLQNRQANGSPAGIISAVWCSAFRMFAADSVAALFDGVFLVMYDFHNMNSVDFFNAEAFMDFCDVADSLTSVGAASTLTVVRQRWI